MILCNLPGVSTDPCPWLCCKQAVPGTFEGLMGSAAVCLQQREA